MPRSKTTVALYATFDGREVPVAFPWRRRHVEFRGGPVSKPAARLVVRCCTRVKGRRPYVLRKLVERLKRHNYRYVVHVRATPSGARPLQIPRPARPSATPSPSLFAE